MAHDNGNATRFGRFHGFISDAVRGLPGQNHHCINASDGCGQADFGFGKHFELDALSDGLAPIIRFQPVHATD
jgi:hypothetical protein